MSDGCFGDSRGQAFLCKKILRFRQKTLDTEDKSTYNSKV
jgi:hypothetical protein